VAGLIITPHLKDKVGSFLREGDLITHIEDASRLEAEITLNEQEVGGLQVGQRVELKVRALPYQTFTAQVTRIAPSAVPGAAQSTLTIYCQFDSPTPELRPNMTGYARIYTGSKSIAGVLGDRLFRFLRTEWWW
jgi:putative peptide zinc metalloprotease protein